MCFVRFSDKFQAPVAGLSGNLQAPNNPLNWTVILMEAATAKGARIEEGATILKRAIIRSNEDIKAEVPLSNSDSKKATSLSHDYSGK